eukprot:281508_1
MIFNRCCNLIVRSQRCGKSRKLETVKRHVNVDHSEISKFSQMASTWWDPDGEMKELHRMNPTRMDYIRRSCVDHFGLNNSRLPFKGLSVLDIGCGGGLLTESLARLGASVTGVDASTDAIAVARLHSQANPEFHQTAPFPTYVSGTAETLIEDGRTFDLVCAMEIIEHVPDPQEFISTCSSLVKRDGAFVCSTMNKTAKSYLLAIVAAEYVLRWVPTGTHDWSRFQSPGSMQKYMEKCGLTHKSTSGIIYNPLTGQWSLDKSDVDVNYTMFATKEIS